MDEPLDPYCGPAPVPLELWSRWNWDAAVLAGLVLSAAVGVGLTMKKCPALARRQIHCGAIAWFLLFVLFVSPLCALTSALFSARVVHHAVLFSIVAPLSVPTFAGAFRRFEFKGSWSAFAFFAHMSAIWIWHAPGPYAAALGNDTVYWLMQLTLLATALVFWYCVLESPGKCFVPVLLLLGTTVHMALLGAIITFAPQAFYEPHLATTSPWGLTPLEDQQLGGLIMWVPAALPYLVATIWISARILRPYAEAPVHDAVA